MENLGELSDAGLVTLAQSEMEHPIPDRLILDMSPARVPRCSTARSSLPIQIIIPCSLSHFDEMLFSLLNLAWALNFHDHLDDASDFNPAPPPVIGNCKLSHTILLSLGIERSVNSRNKLKVSQKAAANDVHMWNELVRWASSVPVQTMGQCSLKEPAPLPLHYVLSMAHPMSVSILPNAVGTQVQNLIVNQHNYSPEAQSRRGGCYHCSAILDRSQVYLIVILGFLTKQLQPIQAATHTRDRKVAPPDSACLPETRRDVMNKISNWVCRIDGRLLQKEHIFYLYGYAKSGKSAIAQELCRWPASRLLASFFFSRDAVERSQIGRLPNTLSNQLADTILDAAPFILAAVEGKPGLTIPGPNRDFNLEARLEALVYAPFLNALAGQSPLLQRLKSRPYLIVIDGLDECADEEGVKEFLDCTLRFFKNNPSAHLRVFITSRVKQHIHSHLYNSNGVRSQDLADWTCSRKDIQALMDAKFEPGATADPAVQAYRGQSGSWPNRFDRQKLVDHCGGSFTLASALFQFVLLGSGSEDQESTPITRLALALERNSGLDTFYSVTLADSEHLPNIHEVVSTLALIRHLLPVPGIADLLGLQPKTVKEILVELQTIIRVPGTDKRPVTFHHCPSLCSFLTTESRSGSFYTPPTFHLYLFFRCFIVLLKERRWKSSQLETPEQPLAMAYSKQYSQFHWMKAECAFEKLQKQTARSKIFELCSKAQSCQPSSESHALFLDKLGIALLGMVKNQEVTFHIDWIVSLHREALELRPPQDVEARAWTLNNLGLALCVLFEDTGSTPAIEGAISRFREARDLPPSPLPSSRSHLQMSLNNLGNAHYAQYQQSGNTDHILDAIKAHCEALKLRESSPNLDRSFSLDNLGNAFLVRYKHNGEISDVEEAILLFREAVELQGMQRSSTLSNLGDALRCRAEHFGHILDHDEAISLHQRALTLLKGCPGITRRWPLMNVGIAFYSRFKISGSIEDLMQAISSLTESLSLMSPHHIYRQKSLRYLIVSLREMYKGNRSLVYLEEAIKHTEELLVQR